LHRFLKYRADIQTDRQTNASKNPTPATAVGVGIPISTENDTAEGNHKFVYMLYYIQARPQ